MYVFPTMMFEYFITKDNTLQKNSSYTQYQILYFMWIIQSCFNLNNKSIRSFYNFEFLSNETVVDFVPGIGVFHIST